VGGRSTGVYANGATATSYAYPPQSVINNYNQAVGDQSGKLSGYSREALFKFNDDWVCCSLRAIRTVDAGCLLSATNASDGAPLAPLNVTLFNPAYNDDGREHAWTLNGKLGSLKAVYTGATSFEREPGRRLYELARGVYADYYNAMDQAAG